MIWGRSRRGEGEAVGGMRVSVRALGLGLGALLWGGGAGAQPAPEAAQPDWAQQVRALSAQVSSLEAQIAQLRAPKPDLRGAERWTAGGKLSIPRQFSLLSAHGEAPRSAALQTGAKGQPYVVSLWATWCKPCTTPEELAWVRALQGALEAEGLALVNLAVDELSKVQGDARAAQWVYPVWQLKDGHIEILPEAFIKKSGLGLPLFLVVDGAGRPRFWRNVKLDEAGVVALLSLARGLTSAGR